MYIKLINADFSVNNIGKLNSYSISITGASSNAYTVTGIPGSVEIPESGNPTVSGTITINTGYTLSSVVTTMSGSTVSVGSTYAVDIESGTITFNNFELTGDLNIALSVTGSSTGGGGSEGDDDTTYTITYICKDSSGTTLKTTTETGVVAGTNKTFTTSSAPAISGYICTSVSPTSATINSNTTVTYTYTANAAGGDATEVSFANEDFEVGAYDATGTAVDLNSRFRTKATKIFNQGVILTTNKVDNNNSQLRVLSYVNGKPDSISEWVTTNYTIPANTEFHLILAKSTSGSVRPEPKTVTVPTGATKLYVGTLKEFKGKSYVTVGGNTIDGTSFTDGLYYYGTAGTAVVSLTSSSKVASHNGAISVTPGSSVTLKLFANGTVPYVFADNNDNIIAAGVSTDFPSGEFDPLDYFTYEVVE